MQSAAAGQDAPAQADWTALGTQVWLLVTDPAALAGGRRLLAADLADVDAACSRFRPDSELMRLDQAGRQPGPVPLNPVPLNPVPQSPAALNTVPPNTVPPSTVPPSTVPLNQVPPNPVPLSPLLAEAVAVALRAAELTDGDVDPTIGDALAVIGYDRDFALVPADGPPVTLTVRAAPGWRQVRLDQQNRLLTLPPGVSLDLGATAKAWAADRSAARLAAELGCGVLVGLGGDIAVAGPPPDGGWRIRVQDVTGRPEDAPDGPSAVVAIRDGGLATSSTTARRWRRGGAALHHILDPRTGLPAPVYWRTVSVAAASCADANMASTAAIIKGARAVDWLANLGLPARLVDAAGNVQTVAGWPAD